MAACGRVLSLEEGSAIQQFGSGAGVLKLESWPDGGTEDAHTSARVHLTTLVQEHKLRASLSALVKGQAHSTLPDPTDPPSSKSLRTLHPGAEEPPRAQETKKQRQN